MQYREKLVSVIMTVYNAEKYLCEAIDSILQQTYRCLELIIVNDGSTDNSLEIIAKYQKSDQRVHVISRKNRGRAQSLNEAIECSRGEYLAIMDADDISVLTRIEKQVDFLNCHRDVDFVGTKVKLLFGEEELDEYTIQQRKIVERTANQDYDRTDSFTAINDSYKTLHSSLMFKRSVINILKGYREYICEDAEFLFRAIVAGMRFDRIDEELFQYRIHGDSRSEKKDLLKAACISFKTDFLFKEMNFDKPDFKYYIWGSDISGRLALKKIQERFPKGQMLGYLDSYKDGMSEDGYPIFRKEKINENRYDYIFIATNGGGEYARKYLEERGLNQLENFFKIV